MKNEDKLSKGNEQAMNNLIVKYIFSKKVLKED
jgi:hypothetical protein